MERGAPTMPWAWLRRLFDRSTDAEAEEAAAPEAASPAGDPEALAHTFVCRDALLDTEQHVIGYQLLLRRHPARTSRHASPAILRLHDDVLLGNILSLPLERLVGDRFLFISLSGASLESPLLERLPPQGTVLLFGLDCGHSAPPTHAAERFTALRAAGFQIAIDGYERVPGYETLLPLCDFVRIDVSRQDSFHLKEMVYVVGQCAPEARLIAQNVESLDDLENCRQMGFQLFQGNYVIAPNAGLSERKLDLSRMRLLELFSLLRRGAETAELVDVFRTDPMLAYKLLRYINSPGGGLVNKATSIEHALVVLGHQKLYRWLTLLMFNSGRVGVRDRALMENALVRARLAEGLAANRLDAQARDELFVTGMFSLLDILLDAPMERTLAGLSLSEEILAALLRHEGPYAPWLELAQACERFDQELIHLCAGRCGVSPTQVNAALIEALIWAQELEK